MSKKTLQVDSILNELEGASLFFTKPATPPPSPTEKPEPEYEPNHQVEPQTVVQIMEPIVEPESPLASKVYNEQKSNNASKLASNNVHNNHDLVKTIRKAVKQVGKEVLFIRLSPDEKHAIGSIVYSFNELYRGEGRKTSENEIGRIGLNYLLADYKQHGNNSILAQVLAALAA
jgi:hypothetical protein